MASSSKAILRHFNMIIKTTPDKEKVKSMLGLIDNREKFLSFIDANDFPTNAAEGYYEIIKELATALLLLDGLKTIGDKAHKELIDYLSNYKEISKEEIVLIDDLRIKRNKSSYEGKQIEKSYLENKKDRLLNVIKKLKGLINSRL